MPTAGGEVRVDMGVSEWWGGATRGLGGFQGPVSVCLYWLQLPGCRCSKITSCSLDVSVLPYVVSSYSGFLSMGRERKQDEHPGQARSQAGSGWGGTEEVGGRDPGHGESEREGQAV